MEITPYLLTPGKLSPWVDMFCSILDEELAPELCAQTESHDEILELNKHPKWKLKSIVSQITLKLFQK